MSDIYAQVAGLVMPMARVYHLEAWLETRTGRLPRAWSGEVLTYGYADDAQDYMRDLMLKQYPEVHKVRFVDAALVSVVDFIAIPPADVGRNPVEGGAS